MPETYFPTKFDSAAHEVICKLSDYTEGYGRRSFGDVESPVGFVSVVTLDETCDLDFGETSGNYPIGDEVGETARTYGVTADDVKGHYVVQSTEQGFVDVTKFETAAICDEVADSLEAAYTAWADGDETTDEEIDSL